MPNRILTEKEREKLFLPLITDVRATHRKRFTLEMWGAPHSKEGI